MAEEEKKKKSERTVESEGTIAEHSSMKKKKKKKEKSKKESGGDEIGNSESNDEAKSKMEKRKRDDSDLGAEEDTEKSNKEMKRKSKKMKPSVELEGNSLNSGKDDAEMRQSENSEVKENNTKSSAKVAKKKSKEKTPSEDSETKQTDNSEAEEKDLNSIKDAKKKKESEDSEAEDNNNVGTKDAKKKGKKKKKESEDSDAEENNNVGTKDAKKKRKKQSDKDVPTPSSSKSAKKVKFSDQVRVKIFPAEDKESEDEEEEEVVELVRGKRFTKEEDELIRKAVLEYIDNHALGDEGLNMILDCKSHPEVQGCWKEITTALPWRTYKGVYNRAHTIFEAGSSKGIWSKEDLELVVSYQKKHGNNWKALADEMGKHRKHVKDAWRRIRLSSMNRGHWSREEYQNLFDLVNTDLKMKAFHEKHSKHGMLRDNIPWMAISDKLGTRNHVDSCLKWYHKLMSPMVASGEWGNVDDYRLLDELTSLDAACIDDVDWDNLLENRDGEACRKRWNQMVHHIGLPGAKTFAEQVEILSKRYCPELAEDREDFDNRPFDPED